MPFNFGCPKEKKKYLYSLRKITISRLIICIQNSKREVEHTEKYTLTENTYIYVL